MGKMICQVCASKVIWGWGVGSSQMNQDFGNCAMAWGQVECFTRLCSLLLCMFNTFHFKKLKIFIMR